MKRHWAFLRYMLRHKWLVFMECCKLGIPWLGIIHDWSKFLPSEWMIQARTRYNRDGSPRDCRRSTGEWNTESMDVAGQIGLLHHLARNKHHWQYWVFLDARPCWKSLPMPERYRREMLADWRAAGKQPELLDVDTWYGQNRERIVLHPETQRWIDGEMQT